MSVVQVHPGLPGFSCPLRPMDRAQGYGPWDRRSNRLGGTNFGPSSNWRGHGPPEPGIAVQICAGRPRFCGAKDARWRPTGEVLRCLRSTGGFDSRPPRQSFMRLSSSGQDAAFSTQRSRVRIPPALPRGRHLKVRMEDFQSFNARSIRVAPTKLGPGPGVSGFQLEARQVVGR